MTHLLHAAAVAVANPFRLSLAQSGSNSILFVSGVGLLLGMRHATDADHVVALSTLVSRQRSVGRAALIGSLWGVGHTITIFVVGSLIIFFGIHIPTRLGLFMEFSVAVMLVLLGLLNLTGITQRITWRFSLHRHSADAASNHGQPHKTFRWLSRPAQEIGWYHSLRPLVIGLVHGLAGSAAVALLVLSTIRNPVWAAAYLLIFGVGTILGMMLMTTAVAIPLTVGIRRFAALNSSLAVASGVLSLCFGLFLMYRLGYVGGLFGAHPQWTPE